MAVELSVAKGSLKATAEELGITPHILTRWRRERLTPAGTTIMAGPHVLPPFCGPVLTGVQAACRYSTGVINFNA